MLQPANVNPGRVNVPEHQWHLSAGTHYSQRLSGTAPAGWSATGSPTGGSSGSADFNSSSDNAPYGFGLNTVASAQSYRFQTLLFGSYAHRMAAEKILGYTPTKLCFRVWADFAINSANESNTGFGFVTTISATTTDGQKVAWIHTDGSNYILRENTNTDTGGADNGGFAEFVVKIDATNMEWFINGTSQGTLSTPADVWPVAWQVNGAASRTNTVQVSNLLVWYE